MIGRVIFNNNKLNLFVGNKIQFLYKTTTTTTKTATKKKPTAAAVKTTTVKKKEVISNDPISSNWYAETSSLFSFDVEKPLKKTKSKVVSKKGIKIQTTKEVVDEIIKEETVLDDSEQEALFQKIDGLQATKPTTETPVEAIQVNLPNQDRSEELAKLVKKFMAEDQAKNFKTAKIYNRWFEIANVNEALLETNLVKDYPIVGHDIIENYKHLYTDENIALLNEPLFKIKDEFQEEAKKLKIPSLSTIINLSEAPERRMNLNKWKANKFSELGEEGFSKLQKEQTERGEKYHSAIETFVKGIPYADIKIENDLKEAWASLKNLLTNDLGQTLLTECMVKHEKLAYQGRFDAISHYKGNLYLIDWKLTEKRKEGLYDYPLQLVAYLGAFLNDPNFLDLRKTHDIKNVMVVFAYLDGSPPTVFCLNFHQVIFYWVRWLERIQRFWLNVRVLNKIQK